MDGKKDVDVEELWKKAGRAGQVYGMWTNTIYYWIRVVQRWHLMSPSILLEHPSKCHFIQTEKALAPVYIYNLKCYIIKQQISDHVQHRVIAARFFKVLSLASRSEKGSCPWFIATKDSDCVTADLLFWDTKKLIS